VTRYAAPSPAALLWRLPPAVALGLVLAVSCTLVAGCGLVRIEPAATGPSASGPPAGSAVGGAGQAEVAAAGRTLAQVRVVAERPRPVGYDRDCGPGDGCVFGTDWSDDTSAPSGHNGCDTRNDVLGAALVDVRFEAGTRGCDVVAGLLRDPYTGEVLDYATHGWQIHVDHLVPLAAAWDLGASSWSPERRAAFANDTARELVAVSQGANLSKGDSTPADWLPPDRAARCGYVVGYLGVVEHYGLAVTAADAETMAGVLRTAC